MQMAMASRFSAGVCGSTSSMRRQILVCLVGPNAACLQIPVFSISGHAIAVAMLKAMGWRLQWAIMNRVHRQTGRGCQCLMEGNGALAKETTSFLMRVQVDDLISSHWYISAEGSNFSLSLSEQFYYHSSDIRCPN